ncbi:uncharacterized protein [Lepeophtheirus salmonis]|uniref:uncharacterized protein n=1 Tax=Lepeophtheirus salmonis TaxID=72036 RepID=UPI001AE7CCE3|nr:zinc finger protein 729-like [Lepeophtheirus salmonis]
MEFERSILYRLKEVYLEGTFNEIHIQCRNGARRIPSFLLYAISPLFRQDPSWTGVILPDVSLQDLDEFMSCTLSYGSQGTQSCETLFHLFESFTLFSSVRDNKRAAKQQRRCSSSNSQYYYHVKKKIIDTPRAETSYGLRPFRKKIKFIDEVSEDENEEGDPGYDFENESDYEPAFQEEDEEEAEDEYIQEEEESMENTTSNNAIDDNVSSDEDITTSSSQYDDDEDDLYEERNLLRIESEGEDDDLYEYHLSSHQSDLENLDEEDITLVTVKLNEEGQIQMIDQVNDPENGELVDSVGNLLSEESPEKNTKEGSLNNDFLENVTTHRLLLKCFSCTEHFISLCELRYHSAKFHPEGSFFRLPLGHPHAKCLSCMELFSSYRALIAGNKDLQLKDICFCCPHCRRRFMGRINALRSHLKEEHYELMGERKNGLPQYHPVLIRGDIKSYICDFCKEPFESTKLVNLHLLSCSSDYIGVSSGVFCRICGKTFSQLRSLELHCMNMHRGKIIWNRSKMLFCSQCPAARHSKSALRKHFTKQHREFNLSSIHEGCEACTHLTKSFLRSKHLSKEIIFKCPHCKMLFPTHHNEPMRFIYNHVNRFHCDPEITKFTLGHFSRNLIIIHLKGETLLYICDFCSERMNTRLDFNDHISTCPLSTITFRPRYICEFCGFESGTSRSLKLHVTSTHSELSKSMLLSKSSSQKCIRERITKKTSHKYTKCPHCGKLKKGVSLKTHMKRCGLTSVKIKCTDCSMDFKHVEDMQAHSLIHYGQVTCPIHNILFKNESEIYHHVNIAGANNSPRLQCCMCSRLFLYMCNFMQHLRRHLKISPYRCSICRKSVQSYASLRHHVRRMHVEDSSNKNFSCEHCQKEFTTKGHLKEHIAGVHERYNNVHCPVCHKSFNTQKRMKKHLFATHKEMADQFRSHSKVEVFATASFKT